MLADFGVTAVYSPGTTYPNRNDSTREIAVIFNAGYTEVVGDQVTANSTQPTVIGRAVDLEGARQNSMIELDCKIYKVSRAEPDDTGMVILYLEGPR